MSDKPMTWEEKMQTARGKAEIHHEVYIRPGHNQEESNSFYAMVNQWEFEAKQLQKRIDELECKAKGDKE